MKYLLLSSRILYSAIFLLAAPGHFNAGTIGFAASKGVPMAQVLVPLSGIIMIAGALSVAFGYKIKIGALLLVLFLVPTTFLLHNFWTISDPMARQMDMASFMKNISLIGAALMIMYFGAGPLSLDKRLAKA